MHLKLAVNGREYELEVPASCRLIDILRDELGFTGTKEGCGEGECGACTVLLNGTIVNSCLVLAAQINGAAVITIEDPIFDPIRDKLVQTGGVQCGFCTPGIIISIYALLQQHAHPTEMQIRRGLSGNLCRCTGYTKIFKAIELLNQGSE